MNRGASLHWMYHRAWTLTTNEKIVSIYRRVVRHTLAPGLALSIYTEPSTGRPCVCIMWVDGVPCIVPAAWHSQLRSDLSHITTELWEIPVLRMAHLFYIWLHSTTFWRKRFFPSFSGRQVKGLWERPLVQATPGRRKCSENMFGDRGDYDDPTGNNPDWPHGASTVVGCSRKDIPMTGKAYFYVCRHSSSYNWHDFHGSDNYALV